MLILEPMEVKPETWKVISETMRKNILKKIKFLFASSCFSSAERLLHPTDLALKREILFNLGFLHDYC